MSAHRAKQCACAATLALIGCGRALAGLVSVGDFPTADDPFRFSNELLNGLVLVDQQSQPFTIVAKTPPGVHFTDGGTELFRGDGTFTNAVYRQPATGHLSFLYRADPGHIEPGTHEARIIEATFTGWGPRPLDVFVQGDDALEDFLYRDAPGDAIGYQARPSGNPLPAMLFVRTDATSFDHNGQAKLALGDELSVQIAPDDPGSAEVIFGEQTFDKMPRPLARATAIPLPQAALACAAFVVMAAVMSPLRRRALRLR